MDLFDLVAKITLDSSEYERGLDEARNKGAEWGGTLKTAAKVGAAALTAATTAVTAFAGASVNVGMGFDQSMSQVAATMGTTVDQIEELREFALQMGSSTAFSASQAADALNYMALAGYDAETSMAVLPNVLNLAAAGGIDLARASDMVTDAQSALGLSVEEAAIMVDQMAAAASASNTSVEQLGDAFLTIGATARNMSGGTEELSTVLGVLADNGIKGAEGGTHLRNMILSLQNPTDDAAAALDSLGIAVYDSDGNMRSMIDIIEDLQGGLDGMDQASKDAIVSGIFNKTDLAAVNALLGTSSKRFDELTGRIENSAGAAEQMAATQLDNLAGDVTLFKSALEGAQIVLSDQLTPNLREFVQFGTDAISRLSIAFQEGGLSGAMNALGTILSDGLSMIISNLPTFINAGVQLLSSLGEGLLSNLPLLVDAALQIILTLADGVAEHLPEMIPTIVEVILAIVEKLTAPDSISALIRAALQIIIALATGLINAIPTLVSRIPQIIASIVKGLAAGWGQIKSAGIDLVRQIGNGIASVAADAWRWGRDLIDNFIGGIWQSAQNLWNTLSGIGQGIRNFLGFSEPKEGPLSNFHTYAPDMMKLFAQGIKDNEHLVTDQLAKSFSFESTITPNVQKSATAFGGADGESGGIINIVVQSVLDGRVIGETAYKYQRGMARAIG